MREELENKVKTAIRLIRIGAGEGEIEVSYSGGKDSDVILELVKMAGVKYRAVYKNTTIDPPGTIAHCKEMGAEVLMPKQNFFSLIEKNGFPTMRARFCCKYLKEYKVLDTAVHGIRRDESGARAKRYSETDPIICRVYGKKDHVNVILPILSWTKEDITEFIQERGLKVHSLYYDEEGNFHPERRLGCIGCPMSPKKAIEDFKQYPKMLRQWVKSGQKWLENHPNCASKRKFGNVYDLIYHNLFCKSYEDYLEKTRPGLFGEGMDCKSYLEKYFNITL